jgi:ammonium transporter, Amt family
MMIGVCAGVLCYFAVVWRGRMGYDDSLNVVGIHGVVGVAGILPTGLFASKAINVSGADGVFFGHAAEFWIQAITIAAVALFSAIGTWIVLKLVEAVVGFRVSPEDEATGLDLSQPNERAYS